MTQIRTGTGRHGFVLTAIAVAAIALSACGKASESGLEKVIEQQSGGNVDINTDDGGFSIETEDGSMTVDENGNFVVTDENGETITGNADDNGGVSVEGEDGSFTAGSTNELPDSWPGEVPTPDGLAITSAFVVSETDSDAISISGTTDDDEFLDSYGAELEDAGFESKSEFSSEDSASRSYASDAWNLDIVSITGESGVQITISLVSAG